MTAALDIGHRSHRYGSRLALDDVSLTVAPGTFVALLGPNGGGKSTLFRIRATLQRASEGSVLVFGADVQTDAATVRRKLASRRRPEQLAGDDADAGHRPHQEHRARAPGFTVELGAGPC
jgi:ABC-2 type transport system ATP-binding protein